MYDKAINGTHLGTVFFMFSVKIRRNTKRFYTLILLFVLSEIIKSINLYDYHI